MSNSPDESRQNPRQLADAFAAGWENILTNDPSEVDEETVAAYAEGKLSGVELEEAERSIAASPRALDLLHALGRQFSPYSSGAHYGRNEKIIEAAERRSSSRGIRTRWPTALALAASLLIAVSAGIGLQRYLGASMVNRAQIQVANLSRQLIDAEKKQLALLAREDHSVQLAGRLTPDLIRISLSTVDRTRGSAITDQMQKAEVKRKEAMLSSSQRLIKAAELADESASDSTIEVAAALVNTGQLEAAEASIKEISDLVEAGKVSKGELWNLQAGLIAARARDLPGSEAEPLLNEAEALYRRAAEAGARVAWLNLANLRRAPDSVREEAIDKYFSKETDDSLKDAVRDALRIPSDSAPANAKEVP
jgi:hypothetical protein